MAPFMETAWLICHNNDVVSFPNYDKWIISVDMKIIPSKSEDNLYFWHIRCHGVINKLYQPICLYLYKTSHTMDLLWEKFQWILPLYMKPISFQSKASVVCSVTAAIFIGFCLKKVNVFSQHIGKKNKWISEFHRTNHQELKCWSTFCVNYFMGYYLMMQHQPVVKRVKGTHEWAHRPYQLLITAECTNTGGKMKGSHPRAADRCPFVHRP